MFETENGSMAFDDLMHFIENVRQSDMVGILSENTEGLSTRSLFSNRRNPAYEALIDPVMYTKTVSFGEAIKKFKSGRLGEVWFRETVSTNDFPQLTANLLMWNLLALYIQAENVWEPLVKIVDTIPDFRNIQATQMQGLDAPMPQVKELANYTLDAPSAWDRQYRLAKYGRMFRMSWEAKMNDWLRMFAEVPAALANGARNTENSFVTGLFVAAAGPNPLLFSTDGSTNGWTTNGVVTPGVTNEVTGAGANLTADNLVSGYIAMTSRKMNNGNPQSIRPKYLVVPPAQRWNAEKLLEAATLIATNITTSGSSPAFASNVNVAPKLGLTVIENRWMSNIDVSGNHDKTWYLFGDPAVGAAMEVGFLLGHRNPELFRQSPNQMALAGAAMGNPDDGDFESDAMGWKVRHVLGGSPLDPRFAYAFVGA